MDCLTEDVAAHHKVHYHGGGQGGVEDGRTYKIVFRLQLLGGFLQIAGNTDLEMMTFLSASYLSVLLARSIFSWKVGSSSFILKKEVKFLLYNKTRKSLVANNEQCYFR